MGMNWIKTADRLPEDQAGKLSEDYQEILVSFDMPNERCHEVANFVCGEFVCCAQMEGVIPDYWCEITPPE